MVGDLNLEADSDGVCIDSISPLALLFDVEASKEMTSMSNVECRIGPSQSSATRRISSSAKPRRDCEASTTSITLPSVLFSRDPGRASYQKLESTRLPYCHERGHPPELRRDPEEFEKITASPSLQVRPSSPSRQLYILLWKHKPQFPFPARPYLRPFPRRKGSVLVRPRRTWLGKGSHHKLLDWEISIHCLQWPEM